MKGFIKCVDKNYNIIYVKRNDPRFIDGEVTTTLKNYITVKDETGKIHTVFNNDNRLKTGELFPVASKYIYNCKIHGRQQITYHVRLKGVKIPEEYKIYCPKCQEYYLSDLYIPNKKEIQNCVIALQNIHFVSSNQQTPKYFSKYMPQFFKIINNFNLDSSVNLMFSEKIYFLKNEIFKHPKCKFNYCDENVILFKRPGFGFGLYCEKHKNSNYSSKKENEIFDFIKEKYDGIIEQNYRKFDNKELDIYLPELKLGIEFNGLYWHSEKQKNKSDHFDKYVYFKNLNINLINIWEDDWNFKSQIVKSILLNSLGIIDKKINARNCIMKNVTNNEKTIFLINNHIQGNCSSSINLGLYFNEELVSMMTFGKKRMILGNKILNSNEYELLRFCSKCNYIIRGGASKLFKHFIDNYDPIKILSYSNLDIGNGNLYDILGFKNLGYTKLNYWWSDYQHRYHRSGFMKHKLIEEGFDKNKTENEIMYEKGYAKIWGVGNSKWIWENKKGLV